MAGYGATRRVETGDFVESSQRKSRGIRYQRIAGLFEDHVALRPLQAWLPRIGSRLKRDAIDQIARVLPSSIRFEGNNDSRVEDQYIFNFTYRPKRREATARSIRTLASAIRP
jgi:hypothetical protein